jgi:hypothetical protein
MLSPDNIHKPAPELANAVSGLPRLGCWRPLLALRIDPKRSARFSVGENRLAAIVDTELPDEKEMEILYTQVFSSILNQ